MFKFKVEVSSLQHCWGQTKECACDVTDCRAALRLGQYVCVR